MGHQSSQPESSSLLQAQHNSVREPQKPEVNCSAIYTKRRLLFQMCRNGSRCQKHLNQPVLFAVLNLSWSLSGFLELPQKTYCKPIARNNRILLSQSSETRSPEAECWLGCNPTAASREVYVLAPSPSFWWSPAVSWPLTLLLHVCLPHPLFPCLCLSVCLSVSPSLPLYLFLFL